MHMFIYEMHSFILCIARMWDVYLSMLGLAMLVVITLCILSLPLQRH